MDREKFIKSRRLIKPVDEADLFEGGLWRRIPLTGDKPGGVHNYMYECRLGIQAVAEFYQRLGFVVIPISPGEDRKPLVKWGHYRHVRPAPDEVYRWFSITHKLAGIAVLNGETSGWLACRDFDTKDSYEAWAAERRELAMELPTVMTRRGYHVYFRHSVVKKAQHGADGELRVTGINALPPTKRSSTFTYAWLTLPTDENLIHIDDVEAAGLWEFEKERKRKRANKSKIKTQEKKRSVEKLDEDEAIQCGYLPRPKTKPRPQFRVAPDDEIKEMIEATLPTGEGQRNRMIFEFARALKANSKLAKTNPLALQDVLREWHARAEPTIATKAFEETWIDFLVGWDRVRWPKGIDPFVVAAESFKATGDSIDLDGVEDPKVQELAGICRELQRMTDPWPFFVGSKKAGQHLEVSTTTAWRYLKFLQQLGIIAVAKAGKPGGKQATRYWYIESENNGDSEGEQDES